MAERVPIATFAELEAELVRLCDHFAVMAQAAHREARLDGTGGWWELGGYADALSDTIERIRIHRRRTEGIDAQIAKYRAVRVPRTVDAVDPHVADPGTPTPRA